MEVFLFKFLSHEIRSRELNTRAGLYIHPHGLYTIEKEFVVSQYKKYIK